MMLKIVVLVVTMLVGAYASTNMDPKVSIVETVPPDNGKFIVRGFLANDVTLTCFVENLQDDSQVKWARSVLDKDGRPTHQLIASDMDVQDNNKWSIEKPTTYSWRLRIKALQVEDEGNYTCYVRINVGDTVVEANRTILATDPPTIIEGLMSTDLVIKEDQKAELTCNASGRPIPTLMWRREGNAILPDGGVVKLGGLLVISSAKYTDRGKYHCRAVNEVGEISREIFVSVQFTPKLTSEGDVAQAIGYKRTLICYIDADPQPSRDLSKGRLYWTKERRSVEYDDRVQYRILEGAYSRLIYELIFMSVREEDYGTYTCNAGNSMGSGLKTISLTQSDTPVIDKGGNVSGASALQSCLASVFTFIIAMLLSVRNERNTF